MLKLACFDLDDTLIREVHSVMLPCILNGKEAEHAEIQKKEEEGLLDYIAAGHERAKLMEGLEEAKIFSNFYKIVKPLQDIPIVVGTLHSKEIACILVTVGPIQAAKAAAVLWNFDGYYGSDYEVADGRFTGKIRQYIDANHKEWTCLLDYCQKHGISLEEALPWGMEPLTFLFFFAAGSP